MELRHTKCVECVASMRARLRRNNRNLNVVFVKKKNEMVPPKISFLTVVPSVKVFELGRVGDGDVYVRRGINTATLEDGR